MNRYIDADMAGEAVDIVLDLAGLNGHIIALGPEYVKRIKDLGKRMEDFDRQHSSTGKGE